jgi:uncharacterized protein YndB with AHSA1/START domain
MPTGKKRPADGPAGREIVISRLFPAPRELVFRAWTEADQLARWWGPNGFTNPVCEWDARPGGKIYDVMRAPDGTEYPMGGQFKEITPPEKLVMVCGALDAKGAPMFEFQHTVTFVEKLGATTVTITSRILNATEGSDQYTNGYRMGMTQSLDRLAGILAGRPDREIVISRVVDAPRELVWQAWTDPQHVHHWWGPRGFSTTMKKMDFRVGGVWEHVMHGPDGTNYPNKSTFKEIVPLERITYAHGGGREDGPGASFTATWTFETVADGKTKLTGRMVFPTAEARDFVVREFGAIEGGRQTLERLAEYLPLMTAAPGEFVISRVFAAPRELVWQAWTQPEHLQQWFGPKGCTTTVAKMDFRVGGIFHYGQQLPDGTKLWGRFIYREIAAPERLVWVNSFSNEAGGLGRHPFSATWPQEMLTLVSFAEYANTTTVTIKWTALNASAEEQNTFDSSHDSMNQGWGGTCARLTTYLGQIHEGA